MSIELEEMSLADQRWRAFVAAAADATLFHRAQWISVLSETYGFKSFAMVGRERGEAVAGAPFLKVGRPFRRRWSSLPFTDALTPLGEGGAAERFIAALGRTPRSGISSVEVRAAFDVSGGHLRAAGVRHLLPLTDGPDAALRRIAPAHLRNARHAERAGVEISVGNADADVEAFYGLHVRTRRRLGLPVQPARFFRNLAAEIIAPGFGYVATARLGRRRLAAAVFLCSGRTLVYKYGASDEREWSHRPNDLIFRTVIGDAASRGFRDLDFGRTDLEDAGLRRFKSGWGAHEEPLVYTVLGDSAHSSAAGAVRLISPLIRKVTPSFSRALGEVLYRYSA
ncbi:MAG TPA: GNAT family N-acetyltransferase [Candidatus Limnocylindria bacterium]|jgi:CelD/BcsL family acetyltransferase involved in cellulose biosynthesis|nr:GNAT family N-acetyltransferase [Candidatus Limnocylindria bacterium]